MPKSVQKSIKLTELEFNKLLRLTQQVTIIEAQAESLLAQIKSKLAESQKTRNEYFTGLADKYPELDVNAAYTPIEEGFELQLNTK